LVDGRESALSKMVGTVGIGLVLVETAAARAAVRGRLLLVQAEDREGRELGVTRRAEVDDSSSIMTGRAKAVLHGHRRPSRGILMLGVGVEVGCGVLSLPMLFCVWSSMTIDTSALFV